MILGNGGITRREATFSHRQERCVESGEELLGLHIRDVRHLAVGAAIAIDDDVAGESPVHLVEVDERVLEDGADSVCNATTAKSLKVQF